ncbi:MAG: cytochrome c-type biogenesis CcmF C-terminal domain-containing protein [Actinomycetota bacterium]
MTFVAVRSEESARRNSVEAEVRIAGVGVFRPAISSVPGFADGVGTPAIETGPWRDWYVTLSSAPAAGPVRIVVQVGTLVMWLWIGGLVMLLGTLLALVPARRDRPLVPAGTPESVESGSR